MSNQEFIEITRLSIDETQILVGNDHTGYFSEYKAAKLSISALMERYKNLVKKAHGKRVSIAYTQRFKHRLTLLQETYAPAYRIYDMAYQELKTLVTEKMQRGITLPSTDDVDLPLLYKKRNALHDMIIRNTPLAQAAEINRSLTDLERWLSISENPISIRL